MIAIGPATILDPRETPSEELRRLLLALGADPASLAKLFYSGGDEPTPDALRRKLDRRIANDSQATRHVLAMELILRQCKRSRTSGRTERTARLSAQFVTEETWEWANASLPELARYLIASAQLARVAPYGTMHDRLAAMELITHAGPDTQLGRPLGLLGRSLCQPEIMARFSQDRVPLLSVLACRKPIGSRPFVPGAGFDGVAVDYCRRWLKSPSARARGSADRAKLERWISVFEREVDDLYDSRRCRAVQEMHEDCWEYQHWSDALEFFDLLPLDID
ncbi:MAG: hypothetical protein HQL41_07320 [Alphaproteobacteria bacterium]|nr:hypothetical protein [Alphaproteobacteria bacterium]